MNSNDIYCLVVGNGINGMQSQSIALAKSIGLKPLLIEVKPFWLSKLFPTLLAGRFGIPLSDKDKNKLKKVVKKEKYNHEEDVDYTMSFTQEQMEELHTNGEIIVHIEEEGKEMVIKFTYNPEEVDEDEMEEMNKEYNELTTSMLDDELDEYIDKIADSIKRL